MFVKPASFTDFLTRNNYIDYIYEAMRKDDKSVVVMKALDVLKTTGNLPPVISTVKSEEASSFYRTMGNDAFKNGHYQGALLTYNRALLTAPENSRAMKLAFSNRSALFYKLDLWIHCHNDIEKCFAMGLPSDIREKLTKRKTFVGQFLTVNDVKNRLIKETYKNCFNFEIKSCNPQIPCASSDVKVMTSGTPKIVASNDIKIGTIVASETAYVTYSADDNCFSSCHYCQKKSLNLIPCDGCCFALFCDEDCKSKCFTEFHKYECKIIEPMKNFCCGPMPNLMVKATLKLRKQCKSWKELIEASKNTGIDRIRMSSVEEMYDGNNIFSILTFEDMKPFTYGVVYTASFICAAIIHYLDGQTDFFPKNVNEKKQAMQALGRIMMYFSVYQIPLYIIQAQHSIKPQQSNYGVENFGLFPFIGKLKRSCRPNLIMLNNNNKIILKAIRSIKCGEELTVSYLWNIYDTEINHARNIKTFLYHGTVCGCTKCDGNSSQYDDELSVYQKSFLAKLNIIEIAEMVKSKNVTHVYKKLLPILDVLKNVQNSRQYIEVYRLFRLSLLSFELIYSENFVLDNYVEV